MAQKSRDLIGLKLFVLVFFLAEAHLCIMHIGFGEVTFLNKSLQF
jgi:hypothetical protein